MGEYRPEVLTVRTERRTKKTKGRYSGFLLNNFSRNKSLINQGCSAPYLENIGPWSFLYGPRCAPSVLSRPRADIPPVRPSRLVNKIYLLHD